MNLFDYEESQIEKDPADLNEIGYPVKTFDPREIDITVEQQNIDFLLYKMEYDFDKIDDEDLTFNLNAGVIDLNTEFQRSKDLWSQIQMSRLIESILIRFPLPAFYFDTTTKNKWQIIDGLQRLSTLRKFIIEKKEPLKLKGLEFLDKDKFEDITFDKLPEPMQRTIRNTQVILILIRPGTPKEVKYRIFERVNTGGLKLNKQEIRHAINQGIPSNYVKDLAESKEFKKLTRINNRRMEDRELCLRFIAFKLKKYDLYQPPMYNFLDLAMEEIGKIDKPKRNSLRKEFIAGLSTIEKLLGINAFSSKVLDETVKVSQVNKAIFECLLTCISNLGDEERNDLVLKKGEFIDAYANVLLNESFIDSITLHTSDKLSIKNRFDLVVELLAKVLK